MLVVGLGLAIFQQVVGINTVIYYSPTILSLTGLEAKSAITQALFIGLTNVAFTIVTVLVLDRIDRRVFLAHRHGMRVRLPRRARSVLLLSAPARQRPTQRPSRRSSYTSRASRSGLGRCSGS